ncbi:zinc ribbon domain protein [mine drainage metagenome]|uniref:Zinc ribbon domain protein n=1 Tax=mine drainage metagenome TaxID=410659 RepID=A0A1J5RR40_9ZZZZ
MPLYSYHCTACGQEFELLVRGDDSPACPHCHSAALERLPGAAALPGKTRAAIASARRQAAREGHFSHYSKAEKAKL